MEVPIEWLAAAGVGDMGLEATTRDVPREFWPPEVGAAILVPGAGGGTLVRGGGGVGPLWICLGWARACAEWRGWPGKSRNAVRAGSYGLSVREQGGDFAILGGGG
ncbi:hypothetical protein NDU88_006682 [Pleurodeles waltl]|uniref:Uncharacterized protein n=1 Tax=Pleurodeles waltl TaxID=8319 RepID=A0AAV7X205_PLEWA|nr:hypothetical protein NDU88_006682 [Pleurodeles waltl]